MLTAQPALSQSAWVGPCELAEDYMRGANFQAAYRGVHRETLSTDPCGRDVVTVYNLLIRSNEQATYDVTGRQYYVWPTRGNCDARGAGPFVRGVVRLTQQRQANGANCRVVLTASFDLTIWQVNQQDGQSIIFSAPITPIGVGAQQFAVSRVGETEAMIFYAAVTIPHVATGR
ncbi:hypothetical protein [Brevundimonas sp.]|uniref:hypothetical protein n=1 Tax=Brevundimonas sp. TaxID=1871086 RepID=UPI003D0F3AC4